MLLRKCRSHKVWLLDDPPGGVEGEGRERGRADPDAALAEVVREHRVELVVDDDEVDRAAVSSTQYL